MLLIICLGFFLCLPFLMGGPHGAFRIGAGATGTFADAVAAAIASSSSSQRVSQEILQ